MTERVLHVGILPTDHIDRPASFDGEESCEDRAHYCIEGFFAYVSGTWEEWGEPEDYGRTGTLHLAVLVDVEDNEDDDRIPDDVLAQIRMAILPRIGDGCRLTDYMVVSDEAWSERQRFVTCEAGGRWHEWVR